MLNPDDIAKHLLDIKNLKAKAAHGPWQDEPDRLEYQDRGFHCLIQRNHLLVLCGYVAMPASHPWFGKSYGKLDDVLVHGGLTYGDYCQGTICHKTDDEKERAYWLGFDCGHAWDITPALIPHLSWQLNDATYRDIAYVKQQVAELVSQSLAAAMK